MRDDETSFLVWISAALSTILIDYSSWFSSIWTLTLPYFLETRRDHCSPNNHFSYSFLHNVNTFKTTYCKRYSRTGFLLTFQHSKFQASAAISNIRRATSQKREDIRILTHLNVSVFLNCLIPVYFGLDISFHLEVWMSRNLPLTAAFLPSRTVRHSLRLFFFTLRQSQWSIRPTPCITWQLVGNK